MTAAGRTEGRGREGREGREDEGDGMGYVMIGRSGGREGAARGVWVRADARGGRYAVMRGVTPVITLSSLYNAEHAARRLSVATGAAYTGIKRIHGA